MRDFWVTVAGDEDTVLSHCYTAETHDEAVARMMAYLRMEFEVQSELQVTFA